MPGVVYSSSQPVPRAMGMAMDVEEHMSAVRAGAAAQRIRRHMTRALLSQHQLGAEGGGDEEEEITNSAAADGDASTATTAMMSPEAEIEALLRSVDPARRAKAAAAAEKVSSIPAQPERKPQSGPTVFAR